MCNVKVSVPGIERVLLAARRQAGLELHVAAEMAGIPELDLSRFETGERAATVAQILALGEVYGVTGPMIADAVEGDPIALIDVGLKPRS